MKRILCLVLLTIGFVSNSFSQANILYAYDLTGGYAYDFGNDITWTYDGCRNNIQLEISFDQIDNYSIEYDENSSSGLY